MKATFWIICLLAGLYGCNTAEGESSEGPRHSIVFVTKRPGGYDILLEVMNERVTVCLHDKDIVVVTLYNLYYSRVSFHLPGVPDLFALRVLQHPM
jgi:hypothetical protein